MAASRGPPCGNVSCQLFDPVRDEGAIHGIDARPVTRRRIRGFKAAKRLQQPAIRKRHGTPTPRNDPACRRMPSNEDSIAFPIRCCSCHRALSGETGWRFSRT